MVVSHHQRVRFAFSLLWLGVLWGVSPAVAEGRGGSLGGGEDEFTYSLASEEFDSKEGGDSSERRGFLQSVELNYFGIFFGPSIQNPSGYQPSWDGHPDLSRPVMLKNVMGLGYRLNDQVSAGVLTSWFWQPIEKGDLTLLDPAIKVALPSLWRFRGWNYYVDTRVHVPMTRESKQSLLKWGAQLVQVLTYEPPSSRLTLGLASSFRYNALGESGRGNDWEAYLGPHLNYQVLRSFALTLLFEMRSEVQHGSRIGLFQQVSTDLEPGVNWDLTPNLAMNPYLHVPFGGRLDWNTISMGMTLNWSLL